jgi:hypothetical protein
VASSQAGQSTSTDLGPGCSTMPVTGRHLNAIGGHLNCDLVCLFERLGSTDRPGMVRLLAGESFVSFDGNISFLSRGDVWLSVLCGWLGGRRRSIR